MKRLGVFLLPPVWDASPLRGYPQHKVCWFPFIYLGLGLGGEALHELKCLAQENNTMPWPGLKTGPSNNELLCVCTALLINCYQNFLCMSNRMFVWKCMV